MGNFGWWQQGGRWQQTENCLGGFYEVENTVFCRRKQCFLTEETMYSHKEYTRIGKRQQVKGT